MARNLAEISNNDEEKNRLMGDKWNIDLRVACPGIIQSFDPIEQTVTVQLALRENVSNSEYEKKWKQIPQLLDVPIIIPRAGGYCITMPIRKGDECLVIFGDMCIDAWWEHGGIQNQMDKSMRRHDLSDGFAILGPWSQPRVIKNYSTDSCQIRNESGNSCIELKDGIININSNTVNINAKNVNVNASQTVLDGIVWDSHKHPGVHGMTGGPC